MLLLFILFEFTVHAWVGVGGRYVCVCGGGGHVGVWILYVGENQMFS